MKYQVTFVATYETTVEIEAPDRDKALERAQYLLNAKGEVYPEHMTHNGTKSDKYNCMVVGVEAGEQNLTMISPSRLFEQGDIIWVVGEEKSLQELFN